jgi:uncharacterized protein
LALLVCFCAGSVAAGVAKPSFDCAKATGKVQEIVCQNENLAEMDLEISRLYNLALHGSNIDAKRANALKAEQRAWLRDRDECWKGVDLRQCVMTSYARRIHQLRQGYLDARTADDVGHSIGPVAYRCKNFDALIAATFVNTEPGAVYLEWADQSLALDRATGGSGNKYTGRWNDEEWLFWTKGREAILSRPGLPDLQCSEEPIG